MNRRTFAGLMAGAAVCSTGKFTTETRAESKPPDTARMLEVTRAPGVAVAGMKQAGPFQLFAGVERAGGPRITVRTRFPAASLSKPVFAWAVRDRFIQVAKEFLYLDLRFIFFRLMALCLHPRGHHQEQKDRDYPHMLISSVGTYRLLRFALAFLYLHLVPLESGRRKRII